MRIEMLVSDRPKRVVSQALLKETACRNGCGAVVHYRTNPRVSCASCREKLMRQRTRKSAEVQRRKRGVPQVKGQVRNCSLCSKNFTINRRLDAKVCGECRTDDNRRRARERVRRLCRERGAVEIGSQVSCRRCGDCFTVKSTRNYLCPPCGEKSVRMQHPDLREKQRAYTKQWLASPEGQRRNKAYQARSRTKRKADPAFTINERMSAGIRYSLVSGKQGSSWQDLVSYTLVDLMAHLEAKFLPGMSWDNRGDWHIDHVRPLCSFDFQTPECPQFREAWALTNLQPLWATDNLKKGGRWAA